MKAKAAAGKITRVHKEQRVVVGNKDEQLFKQICFSFPPFLNNSNT